MLRYCAFVIALLICSTIASAQVGSFTIGGGYSRLYPQRSGGLTFARDGAYVDGDFLWRVPNLDVPLLLGFGLSGSAYYRSDDVLVPVSGNLFVQDTLESDVGFFSVEARAAVPISFRAARGFFVMPRLGAGLLVDEYSIDTLTRQGTFDVLDTIDHSGAAFEIRPALQAGYSWGAGSIGAEVSYMAAWGDFGRLGSRAQELRAGVFLRLHF